jgi:hypothetical protein
MSNLSSARSNSSNLNIVTSKIKNFDVDEKLEFGIVEHKDKIIIKNQGSIDTLTKETLDDIRKNRFPNGANATLYKTDGFSSYETKYEKIKYDAVKHAHRRDVKGILI